MENPKVSLVRTPSVKVTLKYEGLEEHYSALRRRYPPPSQLIVRGSLRDTAEVKIVNMLLRDPEREEFYKEYPYGDGAIMCYKIGASFESVKDEIRTSDILGLMSHQLNYIT